MRVLAVLVVVLGFGVASADGDDNRTIAKRLFDEGRVLSDRQKYIEACVLFEKSYQLDPAVGTRLNLADCAEREGKPRAAWLLWISAADEFERGKDDRAAFARKRADALATKLATVEVRVARPATKRLTVQIGGREVTPAAVVVERLDPGAITVTVSAPARQSFTTTVDVAIGQSVVVEVPKLARIVPTGTDDDEPPKSRAGLWTGLAIGGGVVALGSLGFAAYSADRTNDLEGRYRTAIEIGDEDGAAQLEQQGEAAARNANIGLVVAAAAGVLSTVSIYYAVKARRASHATTSLVVPVVTPKVAGVALQLHW